MKMRIRLAIPGVLALWLFSPMHAQSKAAGLAGAPATDIGLDVLSDKGGVDLNPYFEHLVGALNQRWQPLVAHAETHPPASPEETVIAITILPNGQPGAMRLESSTHDGALNKAAWEATNETKFAPPPAGMRDANLKLRLHFKVR